MATREAGKDVWFFDAHCHLQDARLAHCLDSVLKEARDKGVRRFSVNGCSEADWDKVLQLAEDNIDIEPNIGLHPWWVAGASDGWLEQLRQRLVAVPRAGLGEVRGPPVDECGLDFSARAGLAGREAQLQAFRAQLRLGAELRRPVSVHCVRAVGPVADELRAIGGFPAGLVLHSWAGHAEATRQLAALDGVHFSLSGHSLRLAPRRLAPMLAQIPLNRLLLETDCPDGLPRLGGDKAAALCSVPAPPMAANARGAEAEGEATAAPGAARGRHAEVEGDVSGSVGGASAREAGGARSSGEELNHPANIRVVLNRVAGLMGRSERAVAAAAYENAEWVFSHARQDAAGGRPP